MPKSHNYQTRITWRGNTGSGTGAYSMYERDFDLEMDGKQTIACSSDPSFRGDPKKHNPEEFLLASLSSCHMLSYLYLCATNGITVESYVDDAQGEMIESDEGGGQFNGVVLRPIVVIRENNIMLAEQLHEQAHQLCFIANSVNFPVTCKPEISIID